MIERGKQKGIVMCVWCMCGWILTCCGYDICMYILTYIWICRNLSEDWMHLVLLLEEEFIVPETCASFFTDSLKAPLIAWPSLSLLLMSISNQTSLLLLPQVLRPTYLGWYLQFLLSLFFFFFFIFNPFLYLLNKVLYSFFM